MTSSNLEELLARENPVLDPEDARLSGEDVEARCAAILEGRRAMPTTMPVRERPSDARLLTTRLRPALAFAAGLILILAAVGSVALWARGGGIEPADEPTATTQALPSTTVLPEATTVPLASDEPITAPAYGEMPSFSGVVQYSEHDPESGDPGWQATVELAYAGPLQYEATVIEESGERLALAGPGTVFFGDGAALWINEPDDLGPWKLGFEPFRHLFFDVGEQGYPAWDEICAESQTVLGVEVVAGRTTTHVTCSSTLEDYELWVDEESGLVLRMIGPLGVGDFSPIVDRDGIVEFIEIRFEPVTTPSAPVLPSGDDASAFPPYHMVRTVASELTWETLETWYLGDGTVRETYIDASEPAMIGSFTLIADDLWSGCTTFEGQCHSMPIEPDDGLQLSIPETPLELVAEHCTEADGDTVAGRPARHFMCDGVYFVYQGYWQAGEDPATGVSEHWYDTETELGVKYVQSTWSWEATLLDINPVFPVEIFEYVPMEFHEEEQGIRSGDLAPLWSGPLVGGGMFEMADHRGEQPDADFVVLYDWFPGCGDVCSENLVEFQRLYDTYGTSDNLAFVTVSEDTESETNRVLDRLNIDVPTVHCGWDPDAVCLPDSPWMLWSNAVPSVTVVDPDGEVVDVFMQPPIDDELRDLLESITAGS